MKKRPRVGLLICSDSHYLSEITRGAHAACLEMDADFIILNGGKIKENQELDHYQKSIVYQYANVMDLDFLLIPYSSICPENNDIAKAFLKSFEVPIIILNQPSPLYSSVSYNNFSGTKEAVDYMIENCGCLHLGMISGKKDSHGSIERVEAFKTSLKNHTLAIQDDDILYASDYTKNHNELIRDWLILHPYIDGIMCASDELALCLFQQVNAVTNKKIGRDIFICGFDDEPIAAHCIPLLSSCHTDPSYLGYMGAIEGLSTLKKDKHFHKTIDTFFIPRESVGYNAQTEDYLYRFLLDCKESHLPVDYVASGITNYVFDNRLVYHLPIKDNVNQLFTLLLTVHEDQLVDTSTKRDMSQIIEGIFTYDLLNYIDIERFLSATSFVLDCYHSHQKNVHLFYRKIYSKIITSYHMIISKRELHYHEEFTNLNKVNRESTLVNKYNHIFDVLANNLQHFGVKNAKLYLYQEMIPYYHNKPFELPDKVYLKLKIENQQVIPCSQQAYYLHNIFNDIKPYQLISAIYSNDYQIGFFISDLSLDQSELIDYISSQIGSSLHFSAAVNKLKQFSTTDTLTGLLNRRGLIESAHRLLNSLNEKENAYFFLADIDRLKYINDNFGHKYGDEAIKVATHIINRIFKDNSVIGRIGGDEFVVIFKCAGTSFINHFKQTIEDVTLSENHHHHLPFKTTVSYGISVIDVNHSQLDLTQMINDADALMYERKKKKKMKNPITN